MKNNGKLEAIGFDFRFPHLTPADPLTFTKTFLNNGVILDPMKDTQGILLKRNLCETSD